MRLKDALDIRGEAILRHDEKVVTVTALGNIPLKDGECTNEVAIAHEWQYPLCYFQEKHFVGEQAVEDELQVHHGIPATALQEFQPAELEEEE